MLAPMSVGVPGSALCTVVMVVAASSGQHQSAVSSVLAKAGRGHHYIPRASGNLASCTTLHRLYLQGELSTFPAYRTRF